MKMDDAMKDKKSIYKGQDLSDKPKSVTHALAPLVGEMAKMTFDELKQKFIDILNSKDVSVSKEKKQGYFNDLAKQKNLVQLQKFISGIVLKGSGEGVIK